jgi:heme oxygenase (biliverdin-IX-beta and delta-forming)
MIDPLAALRLRTGALHRQLEMRASFSRLMNDDVAPADVARVFVIFHAFYDGLERVLLPYLATLPHSPLYRPRRALLAMDLGTLGCPLPAAAPLVLPSSLGAVMGVIYAVEGSSLGGQVVARHLASRLGRDFADSLCFFSAMADGVGEHWRTVLFALREVLADDECVDAVVEGATFVFSSLIRLADPVRPA